MLILLYFLYIPFVRPADAALFITQTRTSLPLPLPHERRIPALADHVVVFVFLAEDFLTIRIHKSILYEDSINTEKITSKT